MCADLTQAAAGLGVRRDQSLAHHLTRLAAEEGLPAAQAELGARLSLGLQPTADVRGPLRGELDRPDASACMDKF